MTTQWSVVLEAGAGAGNTARAALATLCQRYWYPLYAYVRRQGYRHEEAADLTQGFFARLIEKNVVAGADELRGKFRTFLLASLKHFLANEWDKTTSLKRGGAVGTISLDVQGAEHRYTLEPAHELTPERLFERRWAMTLLDGVLAELRETYAREAKEPLFERLKQFLAGPAAEISYCQIAQDLHMTQGAVKVAVHRLRGRYREMLRDHIGQTVSGDSEIDAEIRQLFAALGN